MTTKHWLAAAAFTAAAIGLPLGDAAKAQDMTIGVSWRHFQEERWRIDEAGIKSVLEPAGFAYLSADAQSDPQKQLTDVESLLAAGVDALIILAQDSQAIIPAIERAKAEGVPVIAYDAPVDTDGVLFVSFDNIAVGRLMAQAMVDADPGPRWVAIEGDPAHPIVDVFRSGQMEVLQPLIDAGTIEILASHNIENWQPAVAQSTMDQVLTRLDNDVDAVLAMNDGTAGGSAAALAAQGLLGEVALSGQDGDHAALNRIAKGEQTVTIWKNSMDLGEAAAAAAVELAQGAELTAVEGSTIYMTPSGVEQPAVLLEPFAITFDNLDLVLDAGWIKQEDLCQGVGDGAPAVCN
jgi:D-xylose transport system substrate-binding protein